MYAPSHTALLVFIVLVTGCGTWPDHGSKTNVTETSVTRRTELADLTISNVRVYREPGAPLTEPLNISIDDGVIIAMKGGEPIASEKVIDASGKVATAGLWNSHVHFTNPDLRTQSQQILHDMLIQYGFTTVVDTGSNLPDTLALSRQIENQELVGPRILLASGMFVFTDGTPAYLPEGILPELGTSEEASRAVDEVLDAGAHGIKIFSGSAQLGQRPNIYLPPEIIRAVADTAHARGAFVVSHPTDRIGLENAIQNGVDILAHTAPDAGSLGEEIVAVMLRNRVALVPTLKLWRHEVLRNGGTSDKAIAFQNHGVAQLTEYFGAGGEILFGTDVGYMNDYDPEDEYVLMKNAGMHFNDILESMTTAPASRFGYGSGRLAVGEPADVVIFSDDPAVDITALARVETTVRAGRVLKVAN